MKLTIRKTVAVLLVLGAFTTFVGCEKKSQTQKNLENLQKDLKKTGTDLQKSLKDAGKTIQTNAEKAGKILQENAEKAQKQVDKAINK